MMKKLLVGLLLCASCGLASAQTAEELIADGKNTENVTTFGMGYDLKMYSPLRQINKSNVKRLVPVWSTSLTNDMGELAQPTIYNGVMYVVNGKWTFAHRRRDRPADLAHAGELRPRGAARRRRRRASCAGAATIYNGKLFRADARRARRSRST